MRASTPTPEEYDQLTGLPGMNAFRYLATQRLREQRKGCELAFVYTDLADLTSYNSRYGYLAGDKLLLDVMGILREYFPDAIISRFFDDHFVFLTKQEGLIQTFERAHEAVHELDHGLLVELRAGMYLPDGSIDDAVIGYDRAKLACDSIVGRYDIDYRIYDRALHEELQRRQVIFDNIDVAIERGEIKVYYQPILRVLTNEVVAYEALARWEGADGEVLNPASFVDVLEESRLVHKLDRYIMHTACREWRSAVDAGMPTAAISVNLSRYDFELMSPLQEAIEATSAVDMPRNMLHVEVTESAFSAESAQIRSELAALREKGFSIYMDDFGTGYSALNELKHQQFDVVKLDRLLLDDVEQNPAAVKVVSSIVSLTKELGACSLAEGVETPGQLDLLRQIGCDFAQGFYFSRPQPYEVARRMTVDGPLKSEDSSLKGYRDAMGRFNPLSPTPLRIAKPGQAGAAEKLNATALMLVEREADTYRFLWHNDALVEVMASIGFPALEDALTLLNERGTRWHGAFDRFFEVNLRHGSVQTVDFIANDEHCVARGRLVASIPGRTTVLCALENVTTRTGMREPELMSRVLHGLLVTFERIDLLDMSSREIIPLYQSDLVPDQVIGRGSEAKTISESLARTRLHPRDAARYKRFCDLNTLDRRIAEYGRGFLAEAFRFREVDGSYLWKMIVEYPLQDDDKRFVVSCVRPCNPDIASRIAGENSGISEHALLQAILDLAPVGLFWKDRERRFVGTNQRFLDYYGFDSSDAVLDKTDEELGWHVDPDPFRRLEEDIIDKGAVVENALGQCLSHGENHAILASKRPIWADGDIEGLVGFFVDADSPEARLDTNFGVVYRDSLTGLLDSRGMTRAFLPYEDAFNAQGTEFGIVALRLEGMAEWHMRYGADFGEQMVKAIAQALLDGLGVESVIGRVHAETFALLGTVASRKELDLRREQALSAVRGIERVAMPEAPRSCIPKSAISPRSASRSNANWT